LSEEIMPEREVLAMKAKFKAIPKAIENGHLLSNPRGLQCKK